MAVDQANSRMADKRYQRHIPGLGNVGSYQASAIPFITASLQIKATPLTVKVNFSAGDHSPSEAESISGSQISKWVTVINESSGSNAPLRVGFSYLGTTGLNDEGFNRYFVLNNGESYTGEWRVTEVWLAGHNNTTPVATVIAGLTPIFVEVVGQNTSDGTPHGDGFSNWSGSFGVL